jgi:hypothetical protein
MPEKKTIFTNLDLNDNQINNLASPVNGTDALRKKDLDAKFSISGGDISFTTGPNLGPVDMGVIKSCHANRFAFYLQTKL